MSSETEDRSTREAKSEREYVRLTSARIRALYAEADQLAMQLANRISLKAAALSEGASLEDMAGILHDLAGVIR